MKRLRKSGFILLFALLVISAILVSWNWERLAYYRFDPGNWRAAKPEHRYYMARYLIENADIRKWNREEVVAKLGNPDISDETRFFFYNLGPERSMFQIDKNWLDFRFDASGRITTVCIRLD